jgi:predicted AlkP superfamily pyrophosphatase or phosphodiesterase
VKRLLVAGCWLLAASGVRASTAVKPEVVVVISVDQFRYDYLQRFAPFFGAGGFKRFEREGATYTNARQRHSVTSTGPGHAAIGLGTVPAQNGIVANRWLERDAPVDAERWRTYFAETTSAPFDADGRRWWKQGGSPGFASSVRESESQSLKVSKSQRGAAEHASPLRLSDFETLRLPRGKTISLALTDRAAILMGGPDAHAVYWFEGRAEKFVGPNPDVLAFNDLVPGYMPASAQWKLSRDDLQSVTFDPPAAWPLKNNTYGGTFPHPIPTIRALQFTPFAHDLVFDFAQHVLAVEQPDLLFAGISSTDYLGHLYGPDSLEVADSAIRLDRALAAFLDALERRYGERVLVALTSDHGIQSIPEIAKLRDPRADAGRVDLRVPAPNARFIRELTPARIAIERSAAKKLGLPFSADAPLENALVFFFEEQMLYLNPRFRSERVKRAVRDAVRELDGVAGAWTNTETLPPLVRNSFHPRHSGDVLVTLRPGWIWMWGSNSTTHGQPVEADLHVPLMFWGAGVVPGRHDEDASPLDMLRMIDAVRYPAPAP